MYIDLNQSESDAVRVDAKLQFAPLELEGREAVEVLSARLTGRAERGSLGVDFSGKLEGRLRLNCSRCLDPFEAELDVDVRLILVPDAVEFGRDDAEMNARASLLFYAEDGKASLSEIAREQIYLHLPLKPVCEAACRGLCTTCGANRNRLECGCQIEETDPRLAPLLEFKKKLGKR